jgi:Family of unknown function (DUF6167)
VNRGFWFVAGAATGIYGLVKTRRAVEKFTPDGIGARVAALRTGARMFADEVHSGMTEREADLLAELRASTAEQRQLESAAPARTPVGASAIATTPEITATETTRVGNTDGDR